MVRLFAVTVFSAAMLLFMVQPIAAKFLLPVFGGGSAVWSTSLVFFQTMLLLGYAYAHALTRYLSPGWQRSVHLAVLVVASLTLPLDLGSADAGNASTSWWVLRALASSVGLPFFALSATAPLLLRWFSDSDHPRADHPYALYAVSNAGSLLGLIGYLAIEPLWTRATQAGIWSAGFWAVAALVVGCVYRGRPRAAAVVPPRLSRRPAAAAGTKPHPVLWTLFAFVPSALLVAVTAHLSTDVMSIPLLWVVPLALYLVTYIVAFSRRSVGSPRTWGRAASVAAVVILVISLAEIRYPLLLVAVAHLAAFVVLALLCHTALAAHRPEAGDLTMYLAYISLGGVLGGGAAALVAPVAFSAILEYPLAVTASLLLRPQSLDADRMHASLVRRWAWRAGAAGLFIAGVWIVMSGNEGRGVAVEPAIRASLVVPAILLLLTRRTALLFAGAVGGLLVGAGVTRTGGDVLVRERTFFGVHQVTSIQDGAWRVLTHGTTTHGVQAVRGRGRELPAAYYHPSGPIGDVVFTLASDGRFRRVGVVGLGTGALAAYAGRGTTVDFFELDAAVIRIAENPSYFTYVVDARARPNVTVHTMAVDGRLGLAAAVPATYDLIVIDAFSSDSIPTHLLTREAVAMYLSRLTPRGLLAFHVSNRFFDLPPVLARVAGALGVHGYVRRDLDVAPERAAEGMRPSTWVVLAREPRDVGRIAGGSSRWVPLGDGDLAPLWTDDYSNVLGALAP